METLATILIEKLGMEMPQFEKLTAEMQTRVLKKKGAPDYGRFGL